MKRLPFGVSAAEPLRSILFLFCLLLVRAGMQYELLQRGFISVSADEFARGVRAATWAMNPTVDIAGDVQAVWLPVEKYLNGIFLIVWPDGFLVPRVTVFVASCLMSVVAFALAYYLFESFLAGAASALFLAFQPWFVWLSGTPMMEMYYLPFFFAGVLLIVAWLKDEYRGAWFLAGLALLVASAFHVQSWVYINLLILFTLPALFRYVRTRHYARLSRLIAFYVLSNGFIITFTVAEYFATGTILAAFTTHTSFATWYYDGYEVPLAEKLLYYPRLVLRNNSTVVWISLLIALLFWVREGGRRWKTLPLLLALVALSLNSTVNLFSSPPTAAPARFSLLHTIVLAFYVGYAVSRLVDMGRGERRLAVRFLAVALAVALISYGVWWGSQRIFDYPRSVPEDAVAVGRELKAVLDEDPGIYMLELRHWEYLAVDLMSRHYEQMIFDREEGYRNVAPSLFTAETEQISASLSEQQVRYVLLKDESLKTQAQDTGFLELRQRVGGWSIYDVRLDLISAEE